MIRKKTIALILISCISIQVIPLKEMGALFFKSSFIEEMCSNADGSEEIKNMNDSGKWEATGLFYALTQQIDFHNHFKKVIEDSIFASRFIDEPLTQPPLI